MTTKIPKAVSSDGIPDSSLNAFTPTPQDVLSSRAIDGTVYHNTTGKPLIVAVSCHVSQISDNAGNAVGDNMVAEISEDNFNVSDLEVGQVGFTYTQSNPVAGGDNYTVFGCMCFVVPPLWYYKVTKGVDPHCSYSADAWVEC